MADTQVIPDLEACLRAAWPTLPADARQLILHLVWATAGEDSAPADTCDDLLATRTYDRAVAAGDPPIPYDVRR